MRDITDLLEMQRKDWTHSEERPTTPEVFDSMFTNHYGERWWSRITEDLRLIVWGEDVGQASATTNEGRDVETCHYNMNEPERLWLGANLRVLRERKSDAEFKKRQTGSPTLVYDVGRPWRVGSVEKQLKTSVHIKWSDGVIDRYDREHVQFLRDLYSEKPFKLVSSG